MLNIAKTANTAYTADALAGPGTRRGQRLAVDDADDLFDTDRDAAIEVLALESRQDGLADDAFAGVVVERSLQAIAHLNAHRAIILGDDEDRAVIDSSAAELAFLCHAQRILFDLFWR